MKTRTVSYIAGIAAAATLGIASLPAQAASLGAGDWNYTLDSFNDSMQGNNVGGTVYEIHGMAMKEVENRVFFAVNGNLPLAGTGSRYADDGHIGWGDLILNFTDLGSLNNANGSLFAVKFVDDNDSGAPALGLYSNVGVKSVSAENGLLLNTLGDYNNHIRNNGGFPQHGDLPADTPYFNQGERIRNVIDFGAQIGEVAMLNATELADLDFGSIGAGGPQTFGFSIDRSLLPVGEFIAHLAPDCGNDIIAMHGETTPTPEPASLVGLATVGLFAGRKKLRQLVASR